MGHWLFPARLMCGVIVFECVASVLWSAETNVINSRWESLPSLPPAAGQSTQPGVAGPFAGVHQGALIVAGGANFPGKMPWDGGAKAWWADVWVLENIDSAPRWVGDKTFRLPRPLGYGLAVTTADGILCAGGNDAERCYADAFLLTWDAAAREIRTNRLPPLPQPLASMAAAIVGRTLYVAGGQHAMKGASASSVFWALDLAIRDEWKVLPAWPGPARMFAVAAAQSSSRGEEFFLFSGRSPRPGGPSQILKDAYAFNPATQKWRVLQNVQGGDGVSVMAASAAAVGQHEILIFGGDRGELFLELEAHDLAIEALRQRTSSEPADARSALERQIADHLAEKKRLYEFHPGFAREVLSYDTRADTWRIVVRAPVPLPVTTLAVQHSGSILLPSGEVRPGVRTPAISRVRLVLD